MFRIVDDTFYKGNARIDTIKHLREVLNSILLQKEHEDVVKEISTDSKYGNTIIFINDQYTRVVLSGYGIHVLLKEHIETLFGQYDRNSPIKTNEYDKAYLLARRRLAVTEGQSTLVNCIDLLDKHDMKCNYVLANKTYSHDYKSLIVESMVLAKLDKSFDIKYLLENIESLKTQDVKQTALEILIQNNIDIKMFKYKSSYTIYSSLKGI